MVILSFPFSVTNHDRWTVLAWNVPGSMPPIRNRISTMPLRRSRANKQNSDDEVLVNGMWAAL